MDRNGGRAINDYSIGFDKRKGSGSADGFCPGCEPGRGRSSFADYRSRRAQNTLRPQDAELANFGAHIGADALGADPGAWQGVTWGMVDGFVKHMLVNGYAVGSVNNHLSTVKTYAKLAAKAGAITPQELAMIRMVLGLWPQGGAARR